MCLDDVNRLGFIFSIQLSHNRLSFFWAKNILYMLLIPIINTKQFIKLSVHIAIVINNIILVWVVQ